MSFFVLFFYRSLEQFRQCGIFCFIFLSEFGTVPTVWYFLFYFSIGVWNSSDSVSFFVLIFYRSLEQFRQCGIFCFIFLSEFGTVPTVWYFLFYFSIGVWNSSDSMVFFVLFFYRSLEQFRQCDVFCFIFLSEFGTVPTVWYFLFYFSIGVWNSSDSVVFFVLFFYRSLEQFRQCDVFCFIFLSEFGTVPTVWYFLFYFSIGVWNSSDSVMFFVLFFYRSLEQFRQCGIFCFIFLSEFGTVPTVWYFLFYFSIGVWNSSDSVMFFVLFFYRSLEQFRQCGIFCFIFLSEFGTVPTVWYFLFYFSIGVWNSSDSMVFFALFFYRSLEQFRQCDVFCFIFLSEFGTVPTVWYFLFYFSIRVWNSSDSVMFFVLFFYRSLEQFRQCGIFCLFFYRSLEQFRQCGIFCFIFLSEFGTVRQYGIFCFIFLSEFGTVPTV